MRLLREEKERSPVLLESSIEERLVCPVCRSRLVVVSRQIRCSGEGCRFQGQVENGVACFLDRSSVSYFDDRHQAMTRSTERDGAFCLCYEKQARLVEKYLQPGQVILDVGCGPTLQYDRRPDCFLIGLDASFDSVRVNECVDLRVYGTAAALPLADRSVDAILAFYAIHHMVGKTVLENRRIVRGVLAEFARVLKRGGDLFIFDVSPWAPFRYAQRGAWDLGRRILRSKLDMFFWHANELRKVADDFFSRGALSVEPFAVSYWDTFPPVFSLPWFRIPRLFYPFDVNLYRWRF